MAFKIGKYLFNNKEQAESKIQALSTTNEEGELIPSNNTIIQLGKKKLTDAVIDADGNVVTEATFSDEYLVDVMWQDGVEAYGWKTYRVEPTNGELHSFLGVNYQSHKIE